MRINRKCIPHSFRIYQKLRTKYYTAITLVIVPVGTIHAPYSTSDATLLLDDYLGSILYEKGTAEDAAHHPLTKVLTPEGYVDYNTPGQPYCYFRKDHLGSIREVDTYLGSDRKVVQKTQYYPSGTPFEENFGAGVQPYKFTGKEMITMHGLNWQDFGARWLDNVRMQFTSVDPLAERNYSISPYAYCSGNPVNRIDPDGRREWPINETYKGYKRTHSNNWGEHRSSPKSHYHAGDDMNFKGAGNGDKGAPIVSTHDGYVSSVKTIESGDKNAGGTRITVTSEDGTVSTTYMHLSQTDVKVGAQVNEGQQIGEMGRSGFGKEDAYDAHLHYELRINGENVNPVGANGNLIDPQKLITPAANVNLPEVSVEGQGGSGTLPVPTPQLPVAEVKIPENMPTQQ